MKFGRKDYDNRIIDRANKIPKDEPVFLLRANDKFAPELLLTWAMKLRLSGGDPMMAENAEMHAQNMIRWQKDHKVKVPDLITDTEQRHALRIKISEMIDRIRTEGRAEDQEIDTIDHLISQYFDTNESLTLWLTIGDVKEECMKQDLNTLKILDLTPNAFEMTLDKRLVAVMSPNRNLVIVKDNLW